MGQEQHDQLTYRLEEQMRVILRTLRRELNQLFEGTATRSEFFILRSLSENGPQRPTLLAEQFELATSQVTALTDKLYKTGFVTRTRSTEDRRSIVLALTDEGEAAFRNLEVVRRKYLQERFGTLSEEELNVMIHVFDKILATMDEEVVSSN
ncbi:MULTISPECIES: MarR family transcriptional regulator [Exiguobacterium]|uniref:MarR family transcriptional regulator n=1 Tax=Exiguobacterium oxidotolerans TaxID=223958 RepID=A0A653II94_9BACL|nr:MULTISPECIES: MarR family transcriptional regulator [Exiguobacterium]ASI34216.1 MarR family transcriptional regulator [Exiguobacterium sp. N4-1P]VWX38348.1 MarR family transcriptional regulator [Exiguobacterium oxidotolerans]